MKPSEFTPLTALVRTAFILQPFSKFRRFHTIEARRCFHFLPLLISLILNAFALSSCPSMPTVNRFMASFHFSLLNDDGPPWSRSLQIRGLSLRITVLGQLCVKLNPDTPRS